MEDYRTETQIVLEQLLADIEDGFMEHYPEDTARERDEKYRVNGVLRFTCNLIRSQIDNQKDIVKQIYKNE